VPAVAEFFADRPIHSDGTVVMFDWQHLFDPTPEAVAERVRSLVGTGAVNAASDEVNTAVAPAAMPTKREG